MSLRWIILFALLGTACAQQNWTMLTSNLSMYSNETKYDSFGSPGLIRTNNGILLSFYREGATHIGGRGTWQLRSSTNNARSWTAYSGATYCATGDPSGCLFAGPESTTIDVRQVAGGVMADGSIGVVILYYDASKDRGGKHFTLGYNCAWLEFSRSTNNGASWSAPQMLNTPNGSTCAYNSANPRGSCFYGYSYGPAIVTPNGVAVALLQFNTSGSFPGDNKLWLLWTYDNGQTWGVTLDGTHPGWTRIRTERQPVFSIDQYEIGLMYDSTSGDIIGVARDGHNSYLSAYGGQLFYFKSPDLGATWTIANSINLPDPRQTIPAYWTSRGYNTVFQDLDFSPWILNPGLSDGKITIIYGERLTVTNGSLNGTVAFLKRMTFTPATVIANSQAFPAPQTIYEDDTSSGATFGYPSFVKLSPGNTLIQFNDQPVDQTAIGQLWTMTGQYTVAGAINPR